MPRAARARLMVTGNVSSENGTPVDLGPDWLSYGLMLRMLKRGAYELELKRQPNGEVLVAYPVASARDGRVGTGPVYEFLPMFQWWRRRGFSIAC